MYNPTARFIFLDIDGVLRTWPHTCPFFVNTFGRKVPSYNTAAVAHLNWLVRETRAEIVISSTWRCQGIVGMQRDFDDWGIHATIWSMLPPDRPGLDDRGMQIHWWLERWAARHPEVTDYVEPLAVILDDEETYAQGCTLIHTTIERGLTWEHADKAYACLMGKEWR